MINRSEFPFSLGHKNDNKSTYPINEYILTYQTEFEGELKQLRYKSFADSSNEIFHTNIQNYIKGHTGNPNARVVSFTKINVGKNLDSSD